MESDREVPLMTPLPARTYIEAYYILSDPKNSGDLVPLVKRFDDWDLIPDAWPGEGWEEDDEKEQAEGVTWIWEMESKEAKAWLLELGFGPKVFMKR